MQAQGREGLEKRSPASRKSSKETVPQSAAQGGPSGGGLAHKLMGVFPCVPARTPPKGKAQQREGDTYCSTPSRKSCSGSSSTATCSSPMHLQVHTSSSSSLPGKG